MSRLRLIGLFALAKLLLHLATSTGYGYFRDELYYLACTEHLAPGYVDHPSLSILFLWAVRHLLGDSRPALRLLPAVLGAATVALAGLMARALGGGRWAVALAMTGALVAPEYLALDHFYSMNAFDIVFWALAAFLLIRLIDGADPRLWLLLGLVLGLGLANKISVLWLGAGLLAGLVATPQRRWLATRWTWLCGAIALVLFSPYLFWQVRHGWPTLEFIHNATTDKMVAVAPLDFLIGQIRMVHPLTLPLWMGGLAWLFLHADGKRHYLLGWIYLTVFSILVLSGSSRSGYLAPAYTWLFAAGGVAGERLLDRKHLAWLRPVAVVLLIVAGAVTAPLALPLLPVDTYIRYSRALGERPSTEERKELGELGQFYADMQGWDAIVGTIADVYRPLPAQDATAARIFAPDYGVAGALDLLGRRQGLPQAISAHNNYWLWGPRGWDGRVLIVVGGEEDRLGDRFEAVERAATIDCGRCMPYENGRPVWVCRGLRAPVAETWAQIKHYD
ncbi:MAG TPA: glycosyltransferase family 39 protein [Candidatus Dormibacteraeota bacterium]|nr:glycosyltransferase family 39 protein [Candidatus Dormibacteraeota bacterium]